MRVDHPPIPSPPNRPSQSGNKAQGGEPTNQPSTEGTTAPTGSSTRPGNSGQTPAAQALEYLADSNNSAELGSRPFGYYVSMAAHGLLGQEAPDTVAGDTVAGAEDGTDGIDGGTTDTLAGGESDDSVDGGSTDTAPADTVVGGDNDDSTVDGGTGETDTLAGDTLVGDDTTPALTDQIIVDGEIALEDTLLDIFEEADDETTNTETT
ncbi:MAG: hypothetical protein V3V17_06095 [Alphaproteobacteria bacterium]